jgi:hypothetical protein
MFRSQLFDHLQGASFVLSAVTTALLVCVVKLFIWYVAVCCLCVCVPDVLVCGMFGCELVKLFIWYVAVCCLCVCVPDVLDCGIFGCELVKLFIWYVAVCCLCVRA